MSGCRTGPSFTTSGRSRCFRSGSGGMDACGKIRWSISARPRSSTNANAAPRNQDAARLIVTTPTQPRRYGLSGEDRVISTPSPSGPDSERRTAEPDTRGFDLGRDPPTVRCQAAYAKNRTEAVQPIRPDLAALLRAWVATRPKGNDLRESIVTTAEMSAGTSPRPGSRPTTFTFPLPAAYYMTALIRRVRVSRSSKPSPATRTPR